MSQQRYTGPLQSKQKLPKANITQKKYYPKKKPFAPPFSKNHVWCDSHGFPIALCCIVAGKDDVPFATVPKYHQKKINQKMVPLMRIFLC